MIFAEHKKQKEVKTSVQNWSHSTQCSANDFPYRRFVNWFVMPNIDSRLYLHHCRRTTIVDVEHFSIILSHWRYAESSLLLHKIIIYFPLRIDGHSRISAQSQRQWHYHRYSSLLPLQHHHVRGTEPRAQTHTPDCCCPPPHTFLQFKCRSRLLRSAASTSGVELWTIHRRWCHSFEPTAAAAELGDGGTAIFERALLLLLDVMLMHCRL